MIRPFLVFALVLFALTAATPPATAQLALSSGDETAAPALPDPLTPETIRALVSELSDAEVRALLLDRLDAVAAEAEADAETAFLADALETATATGGSILSSIERAPDLWGGIASGIGRFFAPRGWDGVLALIGLLIVSIAVGLGAEWGVNRIARTWRHRIRTEHPQTLGQTLGLLVRRGFLDTIGLIVFYTVTRWMLTSVLSNEPPATADGTRSYPDALIATTFVGTVIMLPRIIRAINRFLMAPSVPALRLVNTDDWTAQYLQRQNTIVFAIWGGMAFVIPFLASHGVPMGELRLGFWLNGAAYGILMYTCWRARAGLPSMLMGRENDLTPNEQRMARAYPYLCMVLVGLTWGLIEVLVVRRLFQFTGIANITLMIFLFTPAFDTMVRGLVRHLVPPMSGDGALAERAYLSTKRSYIRIGRVLIGAAVILGVSRLWQIDLTNLAAAGVGAQVAGRMIEIIMILLAGYLVWELVSLWINRKLAAEQTAAGIDLTEDEPGGGEGGQAGGSRLSTVLPLLLGTIKAAIAVIFGLIALGHIGIDITPLLAGAGIVGLAVGFGAQKLVTDVVSGVFFLIDDAFRTGEYVEVEGTVGTVEKISIRSMQLRHHKGPVHTIPYGEIPKITNYSRDWVIMKLKFTVPFETDPNKVKKLFKQIGKDMAEIPEFAADLLQPFKSQGVFDFDDVGMIIRGKFMAKPGRQFVLRKEIYNRVKKIFEENGIAFARREVRVAIPGLEATRELGDDDKAAIAAAATQAVNEMDAAGTTPPKP